MKSRHRHPVSLLGICGLASIVLASGCSDADKEKPESANAETPESETTPPVSPAPEGLKLSPTIPFDVTVPSTPPPTPESLQHDFDKMSWQTFVAMSWPVLPDGQPDLAALPGQDKDNATVWETWKDSSEIFLPEGAPPAPWKSPPAPGKGAPGPGERYLVQIGKTPGLLSASTQPFKTGPLIDQNGRYAHFEILVNETMFNYIVDHKLYNKQAQADVTSVVFPCGTNDPNNPQVGTIMVKAAWKSLSSEEIEGGRFHTAKALIYTPASTNPVVTENSERATVGLVGLHIVHKTKDAAQWVWSTFEHVDNCPTEGEVDAAHRYSFYNSATPGAEKNSPPPRPWNPSNTEPPDRRSQIVRQIPTDGPTRELNSSWQAALRGVNPASVWQYYELIGTQWPTQPAPDCDVKASAPANMSGAPAPQFLGNSTLESYIQGKVPNVSSSCIECHLNATTTTSVFSDFTFLLERAE